MKKDVGHAFSDGIYEEKIRRQKKEGSIGKNEVVRFLPLVILVLVFLVLFLRLFTLQVVRASYYARLSDENRIRTELITAPRGIILDRNGQALVRNTPAFGILKENKIEWLTKDEALKRISNNQKTWAFPQREYLYKDIFAHALGYIGQLNNEEVLLPDYKDYGISDFTGRMGLEEQYEKFLHGENGKELYEVNAKGEKIRLLGKEEARSGYVINTTLDTDLQKAAYEAMKDIKKGAVVVSDPRNGEILALYSKPSFDPNLFTREEEYKPTGDYTNKEEILTDNENQPLLNRAIGGVYPPGSTFKIVTAIAALKDNAIEPDTEFEDTGVIEIGGSTFGTWNYLEHGRKEGNMNVTTALKRSNDIFFYHAGMKAGVDTIATWARTLGLGEKSGIDIPGEVKGTIPNPAWKEKTLNEQWYLGDTINMSIGQGYLEVTPLQVNRYTQVIASNGELYRPHIIKGADKLLKKDIISDNEIKAIKEGMRQACETGGTGYPLFNFKVKNPRLKIDELDYVKDASAGANMVHVTMGCKTGTSEAHGYEAKSHAWFTVFAPFYNPEIAITVLAENAGQGSDVAAPVARDIMKKYFERK